MAPTLLWIGLGNMGRVNNPTYLESQHVLLIL